MVVEASAQPVRDLRASLDSFERIDYDSDELCEEDDQAEGLHSNGSKHNTRLSIFAYSIHVYGRPILVQASFISIQHGCASDEEVMSPPTIKTTWRGGMGFKGWAGKPDAAASTEKNSRSENEMKKDFKARQPHACQHSRVWAATYLNMLL